MIKYKIRSSDWLAFPLIIVNFNHLFIQLAPGFSKCHLSCILKLFQRYYHANRVAMTDFDEAIFGM